MKLSLQNLILAHGKLKGHPVDLAKFGGLALQRAGHSSPVKALIERDSKSTTSEIEWFMQELNQLVTLDDQRVTEYGAEALALLYVNNTGGWVVKRKLQRSERADWLMQNGKDWLTLEVSGTATGDSAARLQIKKKQAAQCPLPAERLTVIVAFYKPLIAVG